MLLWLAPDTVLTNIGVIHIRLYLETMQFSKKGGVLPLIKASEESIKLWSKILEKHWDNSSWRQGISDCKDIWYNSLESQVVIFYFLKGKYYLKKCDW